MENNNRVSAIRERTIEERNVKKNKKVVKKKKKVELLGCGPFRQFFTAASSSEDYRISQKQFQDCWLNFALLEISIGFGPSFVFYFDVEKKNLSIFYSSSTPSPTSERNLIEKLSYFFAYFFLFLFFFFFFFFFIFIFYFLNNFF